MTATAYAALLLLASLGLSLIAVLRRSRKLGLLALGVFTLFVVYAGILVVGLSYSQM